MLQITQSKTLFWIVRKEERKQKPKQNANENANTFRYVYDFCAPSHADPRRNPGTTSLVLSWVWDANKSNFVANMIPALSGPKT